MFRWLKSGGTWHYGPRKVLGRADLVLTRALASVLWIVLIGSVIAGVLAE